jgi:hypothetical protein
MRMLVTGEQRQALDRLMPLVYDELRRIARRELGAADRTRLLSPPRLFTRHT